MNVVVLLVDTLRYDYAMQIPQFRKLAERGWVFERMYGGSTFTYPNLCTLRSGLYPHHHNWRTFPHHDPFEAATTLEAELKKAGYTIAMPMDCPPPQESWEVIRPEQEPFFRFCWFTGIHDCVYSWTCNGVPAYHYKACVQCGTEWLQSALDLFSDSYILLFGDHGVGLHGDHLRDEGWDVGAGQVYDFRIHLPCILAGPGLEHRVISEAYSLADIMPTILELLELPITEGLDGVPVGKRTEPVFLEAQSPFSIWPSPVANVFGATDGTLKVMLTPQGWRCYDLVGDAAERYDRLDLLYTKEGQNLVSTVRGHTTPSERTVALDDMPWWTIEALSYLETMFPDPAYRVYEWGAGPSTLWLAQRVGSVVSVEHDHEWFDYIQKTMETHALSNVELVWHSENEYADDILRYADEEFLMIIVDGLDRPGCVANAVRKLYPGGWLLFDDSQLDEYADTMAMLEGLGWERTDYDATWGNPKRTTLWRKK